MVTYRSKGRKLGHKKNKKYAKSVFALLCVSTKSLLFAYSLSATISRQMRCPSVDGTPKKKIIMGMKARLQQEEEQIAKDQASDAPPDPPGRRVQPPRACRKRAYKQMANGQ